MKYTLLLLSVLLSFSIYAQMNTTSTDSLPGRYHRSGGGDPLAGSDLFILADHRFVVTYFGGAISGQWQAEKEMIVFTPTAAAEPFQLFGRHNPELGDSTRIFFAGFYDDETFIRLNFQPNDTNSMQRVFNVNPNCFSFPYVSKFMGKASHIAFACKPYIDSREDEITTQSIYNFSNPAHYNDFTALYLSPRKAPRGFRVLQKGNRIYFNEDNYSERRPLPHSGEDYEFIQQLAARRAETDTVFFNPWYNQAPASLVEDTLNYQYDAKRDAYINFLNFKEEDAHVKEQDGFNQMLIVYPFRALKQREVLKKQRFVIDKAKPLFEVRCGSDEEAGEHSRRRFQ